MSRLVLIAALLAVLGVPASSPAQTQDLSRSFEFTLGHIFAMSLEREIATMALVTDWDAPITVDYDARSKRLHIEILGARTKTDKAKDSLDRFRREILYTSLDRANDKHDTEVTNNQLSIVYRHRKQWDPIIRYRNGKYEVPK